MSSIDCKYIKIRKKGHNFVKMQYRVMKLDLHILLVIRHISLKFQANTCVGFRNIQVHDKI